MPWNRFKLWFTSKLTGRSKYDYLRKFPILNDFTNHELFLFNQIVQERRFKEGELIYQEEFPLAVIYLISEGAIELKDNTDDQEPAVILDKNQFLGIVDMYTEIRRKGDAIALKNTKLLAISHLDFDAFVRLNPHTGAKLLKNACRILSRRIIELQNIRLDRQ